MAKRNTNNTGTSTSNVVDMIEALERRVGDVNDRPELTEEAEHLVEAERDLLRAIGVVTCAIHGQDVGGDLEAARKLLVTARAGVRLAFEGLRDAGVFRRPVEG